VYHTLLLTDSGRVLSTGGNTFGQLGTGNKKSAYTPARVRALDDCFIEKVAAGTQSSALSDRGEVYIWGTGTYGEFLLPQRLSHIRTSAKDIDLGAAFGLAVDRLNNIWTWGSNSNGELGTTSSSDSSEPAMVLNLEVTTIRKVACGGSFVIALGSDVGERPNSTFIGSRAYLHGDSKLPRHSAEMSPKERRSTKESLRQPESDQKYRSPIERSSASRLASTGKVSRSLRLSESPGKDDSETRAPISKFRLHRIEDDPLREASIENTAEAFRGDKAEPRKSSVEPRRSSAEPRRDFAETAKDSLDLRRNELRRGFAESIDYKREEPRRSFAESGADRRMSPERPVLERRTREPELQPADLKFELMSRENERLCIEVQALRRENEDLQNRSKHELQARLDDIRRATSHSSNALIKQLEELTMDLDQERTQRKQLESINSELQRESDRAHKEASGLHRRVLETEMKFKAELSSLELQKEQHIQHLTRKLDEESHDSEAVQHKLHEQVSQLERALEDQRVSRRSAETEIGKKAEHIDRLEFELKDKATLLRQLAETEDELEASRRDLDKQLVLKTKFQRDVEFLRTELDRAQTQVDESRRRGDYELSAQAQKADHERESIASHYRTQISDLEFVNGKLRGDLAQKSKELDLETAVRRDTDLRLADEKSRAEIAAAELSQMHRELSSRDAELLKLRADYDHISKSLRSVNIDRSQLGRDHEILGHRLKDLENELAQKSLDLQTCERSLMELRRDYEYQRRSSEDARMEVGRLGSQVNEHLGTVEKLHSVLDDWEMKYHHLADENYRLQTALTESEAKNQALFDNLERTLALRAKEYRDRTMSMLTPPYRGAEDEPGSYVGSTHPQPSPATTGFSRTSPLKRTAEVSRRIEERSPVPPSRSELGKDYRERIGNTAAKMLEGMGSESPLRSIRVSSPTRATVLRQVSPYNRERSPISFTGASRGTPSKALDEIRARLASLQENKGDLESKMKEFEERLGHDISPTY
jgi:X-linked retinitis pigmentosa GTPase regulator